MSSNSQSSKQTRRPVALVAGIAVATVAGAAATFGAWTGVGLQSASADESTTPFGTSTLLQSQDLDPSYGEFNQQQTSLYEAGAVSACTGEDTVETITGDKRAQTMSSIWSNSDGESDAALTEAIGQASSAAAAKSDAGKLLAALRECQQEPSGHWHYGKQHPGPLQDGDFVWMDSIDGNGKVTGGVAVMLSGKRFGVVEISSAAGNGDDAIKDLGYQAQNRLDG